MYKQLLFAVIFLGVTICEASFPEGFYYLQFKHSGKNLEEVGNDFVQSEPQETTSQLWTILPSPSAGYDYIQQSGLGSSIYLLQDLTLTTNNSGDGDDPRQQVRLISDGNGYYNCVFRFEQPNENRYYLEADNSGINNSPVAVNDYTGSDNQKIELIYYGPPSARGGSAITVTGNQESGEGRGNVSLPGLQNTLFGSDYFLLHSDQNGYSVINVADDRYLTGGYTANFSSQNWGSFDTRAISAANNAYLTQKYIKDVVGWNFWDNNEGILPVYVRYDYDNSANFIPTSFSVYAGIGDGVDYSAWLTLDVIGHEAFHGVTYLTSDLKYEDESGAINESYSDIGGTLIEFWGQPDGRSRYPVHNPGQSDWLNGEDFTITQDAYRDMKDPRRFGNASFYWGTNWYDYINDGEPPSDDNDFGGVHINSGVLNFVFYLLAEGGTDVNDGRSYGPLTGLGIERAGEIAMDAVMNYHTPTDNLEDARRYWLMACNPAERSIVNKAFEAAGVGDVWLEAEECVSSTQGAYSSTETSTAGYSGSGYIQSVANHTSTNGDDGTDRATFSVNVPIDYTYKIWFRINNDNDYGNDSWFYRLGSGSYTMMNNTAASGWVWVQGSSDLNLSAGWNDIEIANREDGLKIDRLFLTTSEATPSGTGRVGPGCPNNNRPPSVSILSPNILDRFPLGEPFTVHARAVDPNGDEVTEVQFYLNNSYAGSEYGPGPDYEFTFTGLPMGDYRLKAIAVDELGAYITSESVLIFVIDPQFEVTITSPASDAAFSEGEPVTVQIYAMSPDASVSEVRIYWDYNDAGTATGAGPDYELTLTDLPDGTFNLKATATDENGNVQWASPVPITVTNAGSGDFWIEAEECGNPTQGAYAVTETGTSGYAGSGYIQSVDNVTSSNGDEGADRATFTVDIGSGGSYKIWFRINNNNNFGDDSWFYRLGSGSYTMMNNTAASGWIWVRGSSDLNLSAGSNNIEIANRENGLKIDKIYLTTSNNTPSGLGEAGGCTSSNQPPLVSITSPSSGASFSEGSSIPVQVAASDPDGQINEVELYWSGNYAGSVSGPGPYEWSLIGLSVGNWYLEAKAIDNEGESTWSSSVSITVSNGGNGDFWFEAEECGSSTQGAYGITRTSTSGYSGSGYIQSVDNVTSSNGDEGADRATFNVNVGSSGTYKIWFRINNNNSPNDDSWFYRLNNGSYTLMNNTTAWGWVWVKGSSDLNLSAGSNNIEIANREDGLKIDKLYLTTSASTPSGLGEAGSCSSSY